MSKIDPKLKKKLLKESQTPFKGLRRLLWLAFAGSAFFDSLASNKGIVLLNTQVRPFYVEAFKDLEKRCNIVDSFFDKENKIRFVPNDLKFAIENAFNFDEVDNSFSKKYFFK